MSDKFVKAGDYILRVENIICVSKVDIRGVINPYKIYVTLQNCETENGKLCVAEYCSLNDRDAEFERIESRL